MIFPLLVSLLSSHGDERQDFEIMQTYHKLIRVEAANTGLRQILHAKVIF